MNSILSAKIWRMPDYAKNVLTSKGYWTYEFRFPPFPSAAVVLYQCRKFFFAELVLSVIVRENRADPKDRGRPFTFIFSQYKSYPKRLRTTIFAEVGVRFSSRYHHIMILASHAV